MSPSPEIFGITCRGTKSSPFKSQAGKVNQMARFSGSLLRISAF